MSKLLRYAAPDSWEAIQAQLATHLANRVCPECNRIDMSLRETYDDHVIARCWGCDRHYRLEYTTENDTVVPGQLTLVEVEYKDVKDYAGKPGKKQPKSTAPETFELADVEIFSAGSWNGDTYTEKDLDDMVAAFEALKGKVDPPLKLGHDEAQKFMGQADGAPALGWISALKRVGSKLVATFKGVPRAVYDLIQAGAYRKRSAEIWWNFRDPDTGQIYRRALTAVSLLGADLPAVNTLEDMLALYGAAAGTPKVVFYTLGDPPADGGLVDSHGTHPTPQQGSENDVELKEQLAAAQAEAQAAKERAEAAERQLAEREAQAYSAQVDSLIAEAKAEGRVLPAQEELVKTLAMALPRDGKHKYSAAGKEAEGGPLDLLRAYLGTMPKLVEFKEVSAGAGGVASDDPVAEFESAVKAYQDEHRVAYAAAVVAIGKAKPELLEAYREAKNQPAKGA